MVCTLLHSIMKMQTRAIFYWLPAVSAYCSRFPSEWPLAGCRSFLVCLSAPIVRGVTPIGSHPIFKPSAYDATVSPAELRNLTDLNQSRPTRYSSNTMADSGYAHSYTTVTPIKYKCGHTVNNEANMICHIRNCSRKATQYNGTSNNRRDKYPAYR